MSSSVPKPPSGSHLTQSQSQGSFDDLQGPTQHGGPLSYYSPPRGSAAATLFFLLFLTFVKVPPASETLHFLFLVAGFFPPQ